MRHSAVGFVAVAGVIVIACGTTTEAASPSPEVPGPPTESAHAAPTPIPSAVTSAVEAVDASVPLPACPVGMVLVVGEYCPEPKQVCKRWLDPPGPYQDYRCAEYVEPATCASPREHRRFCIDVEEMTPVGSTMPLAHQSWTTAGQLCAAKGSRLCKESEWQFACEGEEMRPYPYGFKRDATACNIDRTDLGKPNSGLKDLRAPITAYPKCMSPFGAHDMSGNVEEWSTLDHGEAPQRSSMKGAWWLPGKNTCRSRTLGHGEIYEGPQVGVRCCEDAR